MIKRIKPYMGIAAACVMTLSTITGCGQLSQPVTEKKQKEETETIQINEIDAEEILVDEAAETADVSDGTEIKIDLSQPVAVKGVMVDEQVITITEAGTYHVTGTLTDGQILIDATKEDEIQLILDGVQIHHEDGAAIAAVQAKNLILTLKAGTENSLSDGSNYVFKDDEDEPDAVLYAKHDMRIEGQGSLTIQGAYEDGIHVKDNLEILSGDIQITAKEDGIKGKDSVTIEGGHIVIDAGDDGVHTDGALKVEDGSIDVTNSNEGLEGLTIDILSGDIKVKSSDDGFNAAGDSSQDNTNNNQDAGNFKMEPDGMQIPEEGQQPPQGQQPQGQHPFDGQRPELPDGFQQGGGAHGPGGGMMDVQEDAYINISGGQIYVNAGGDGIDSNGSLYIKGGNICIDGPTSGGDGAIDYGIEAVLSGGTLIAVCAKGMDENLTRSEGQPFVKYVFTESQMAGTTLHITDEEGNELVNFTSAKSFQSVIISLPEFVTGSGYYISTDAGYSDILYPGNETQNMM